MLINRNRNKVSKRFRKLENYGFFLTGKYLPPVLCPGQAAGPLMYKLSWIRLITHDIYTLVHSPPLLLTYCHSTGLANPGGLARISKQQVFPILSSWLPLSALILHRGCQYEQGINEFDHLTSEKLHQGPQGPHSSVPTWEAGCLIDEIIIRLNRSDSLV